MLWFDPLSLTRQEHAEANKAMQHLVQTVEMLQAAVRESNRPGGAHGDGSGAAPIWGNGIGNGAGTPAARVHEGTMPSDGSTIVAEAAEKVFNKARGQA